MAAARPHEARTAVLLGAAFVVVLALLDAFLFEGVAVIAGLGIGALVAAVGAPPRATAAVGVFAVLLGLGLGIVDDVFLSGDHLLRVAIAAAIAAMAVWIATIRQRRELDSARLRVQYSVAQVLSEARSLEVAGPKLLESIGTGLGWQVGSLWELSGSSVLRCQVVWCKPGTDAQGFEQATQELLLRRGYGLPGSAWERAEPVWLPDLSEEANFPRAVVAREAGLRSGVAFPVVAGGQVVGVLEFFDSDERRPDRELIDLMTALGGQVGDFVERVRAEAARRASEARKGAMLESALDCIISIDGEGRVLEFNPAAEGTFGYPAAAVVGRELAELIIPPSLRDRHRAALQRLAEGGEARLIGQRVELTGMRSDGSEFPVELAISRIPGSEPAQYTGFVRDISDRRRTEEERERLLDLEKLARLGAVQARDELESILRSVPDGVTAQAPDGRLLYANDAALRTFRMSDLDEVLSTPPQRILERFDVFDEAGAPFAPERLPGRRALGGEDAPAEVVRFRDRESGEERWSIVKATPVFDKGQVVMAINVFEDISEQKLAELRQRYLSEASRALASTLDPKQMLTQIARLAVPELADWCAVDLVGEDGSVERVSLAHADPAQLERARELESRYPPDARSETGIAEVLRSGESRLYEEIPDVLLEEVAVDESHLELLRSLGLRSVLIVPMRFRDRAVGAITFASGRSGRRFDRWDVELAEEIGSRCAISLENARLYNERSYIAKTLQESLLPAELPHIPGIETAARFHAAGEGTEVGGDFYDFFQIGPRGWAIVVGDVCGKGPDAAAVTALARYTLRAAAMRESLPSRSLMVLNEALLRQRADLRFCTVAYANLEPQNGGARIGLSSGGHPLPLVLRRDGEVRSLGAHGTLLGVVPDPRLEDTGERLEPGDALVFYTDGVTEARGPAGMLGEARLLEVVASCAGLDADAIAARVEAEAMAAQAGGLHDDIAVVVLRVIGPLA